jgi:hypothetical protein
LSRSPPRLRPSCPPRWRRPSSPLRVPLPAPSRSAAALRVSPGHPRFADPGLRGSDLCHKVV